MSVPPSWERSSASVVGEVVGGEASARPPGRALASPPAPQARRRRGAVPNCARRRSAPGDCTAAQVAAIPAASRQAEPPAPLARTEHKQGCAATGACPMDLAAECARVTSAAEMRQSPAAPGRRCRLRRMCNGLRGPLCPVRITAGVWRVPRTSNLGRRRKLEGRCAGKPPTCRARRRGTESPTEKRAPSPALCGVRRKGRVHGALAAEPRREVAFSGAETTQEGDVGTQLTRAVVGRRFAPGLRRPRPADGGWQVRRSMPRPASCPAARPR